MRGVCALNMEAMSVFLKDEHELDKLTLTNEQQRQYYKHKGRSYFFIHSFGMQQLSEFTSVIFSDKVCHQRE